MGDHESYDLIVIGAGPGGYVAAVRAAELGMHVACIEKHSHLGGVCLNVGCIPSKALLDSSENYQLARKRFAEHGIRISGVELDLSAMMARKQQIVNVLSDNVLKLLEGHKIRIIHGTARLLSESRVEVSGGSERSSESLTVNAKAILLATGSEPTAVPSLPFDGKRIVSSTEALEFDSVPERLGIVGGGYIGLELGSVWLRLGSKVTVIEMLPRIATTLDSQVGRSLERSLKKQGMEFRLNSKVAHAEVTGDSVRVTVESAGQSEEHTFDRLLVAVGRRPLSRDLGLEDIGVKTDGRTGQVTVDANYRTNIPSIYAIGDLIAGPMLAHKASAEGVAAVECFAGRPGQVNYDAIPAVVYTAPEVASVGLTEDQIKESGTPYCSGSYPFSGVARARCLGETDGFVKILAHAKTDRILGVHIMGPHASDLIQECVLAMEFGASSEDIFRTVHAHPSLSEALMEAASAVRRCPGYAS